MKYADVKGKKLEKLRDEIGEVGGGQNHERGWAFNDILAKVGGGHLHGRGAF